MKAALLAAGVVLLAATTAMAQWGYYAAPVVAGPVPTVAYYAPQAAYYAPRRRWRTMRRPRRMPIMRRWSCRVGTMRRIRWCIPPRSTSRRGCLCPVSRCGTLCGPSSRKRAAPVCKFVSAARRPRACRAAAGQPRGESVSGRFHFPVCRCSLVQQCRDLWRLGTAGQAGSGTHWPGANGPAGREGDIPPPVLQATPFRPTIGA